MELENLWFNIPEINRNMYVKVIAYNKLSQMTQVMLHIIISIEYKSAAFLYCIFQILEYSALIICTDIILLYAREEGRERRKGSRIDRMEGGKERTGAWRGARRGEGGKERTGKRRARRGGRKKESLEHVPLQIQAV